MPVLYILAGPNGTGKTTFYSFAVQNGFIDKNLPFINVDIITRQLGGYTEENYIKASDVYRETVKKHIEAKSDFMIESNLADSRSYQWLSLMKSSGYNLVLYFLSTDDVVINIGRVLRRVSEGGHNVAESIIRSRYALSHSYLKTRLSEFKEVYLVDNSTDTAQIQVKINDGRITEKAPDLLNWVQEVISIHERIERKRSS
ncbi:MAG: zeta toxin family protein [Dinghuibacter sp.]|nr:zeta toxin family protein [Dinghuibacter sp.]